MPSRRDEETCSRIEKHDEYLLGRGVERRKEIYTANRD